MRSKTLSGVIEYVTDDIGVTGVEHYRITCLNNGERLLRAYCEMHDDHLVRDVALRVDQRWRPLDAYVHLTVDDAAVGSAHYGFDETAVHVQRSVVGEGTHTSRQALVAPANGFGSHSVQNDAWFYGAFDRVRGDEGAAKLPNMVVCSRLANGGEAPALHITEQQHQFHGDATITTPAGTFVTRHYSFHFDRWPPIHYWVHGEDYLLVQCRWDHLKQGYRLTELTES